MFCTTHKAKHMASPDARGSPGKMENTRYCSGSTGASERRNPCISAATVQTIPYDTDRGSASLMTDP